jgi:butyryl-CoA dehydrogenase
MDFLLSKDQQALRKTVRTLALGDIGQRFPSVADCGLESEQFRKKLTEAGLLGPMRPVSCGGRECSVMEAIVVLEELASIAPLAAVGLAEHDFLFVRHIQMFGDDRQKERLAAGAAQSPELGSWCVADPSRGGGSDADAARAELQAEGWILNGFLLTLVNGALAERLVVTASTNSPGGSSELSAFLLDKGMTGVGWEAEGSAGRRRPDGPGRLVLTNVRVAPDRLIGKIGGGKGAALDVYDKSRVVMASLCLGLAASALQECLDRFQTGSWSTHKRPARASDPKTDLSERLAEYETARLMTYRAAFMEDRDGRPGIESAGACRTAARLALKASDLAARVTRTASMSKRPASNAAAAAIRRWLLIGKILESG